jgi:hypothetical protein
MSDSITETDSITTAWKGLIRLYRYHTLPHDEVLWYLHKYTKEGHGILDILRAEHNLDGSLTDKALYFLDKVLLLALEEQDQGQTRKTMEQIKLRYATLKQLYPDSVYSGAPSWFTREW